MLLPFQVSNIVCGHSIKSLCVGLMLPPRNLCLEGRPGEKLLAIYLILVPVLSCLPACLLGETANEKWYLTFLCRDMTCLYIHFQDLYK